MTEPSLLVMLPMNLASIIVSQWLTAKLQSKIDIAYCSHPDRGQFLEILRHCDILVNDRRFHGRIFFRRMQWMTSRGVRCSSMSYRGSKRDCTPDNAAIFDSFVRMNATALKQVKMTTTKLAAKTWLEMFARHSCSLTFFSTLYDCPDLNATDKIAIRTILQNSSHTLSELCIDGLEDLQTIMGTTAFPVLSKVDFYYIQDKDLISLCKASPHLKTLRLTRPCTTRDGLVAIGQYCHHLEDLTIINPYGSEDGENFASGVDDAAFSVSTGCPKLKRLSLEHCRDLTDVGLTTIVTHCTQLEELCVTENDAITDAPLVALADLSKCHVIRSPGIQAIAEHCLLLHTLKLRDLSAFTAASVSNIIPHLKNVKVLHLADFNALVNNAVLALIAEHMPLLEELDIAEQRYSLWTVEAIDNLLVKCEKLKHINMGNIEGNISDGQVNNWKQLRSGIRVGVRMWALCGEPSNCFIQ